MAYGTATLTGTYKTFDDQPASGVVEIIPNSRQLVDAEGDVILAGRVKVTLDEAGSFSVVLPATDDETVEPAAGRQYTVVAKLRHTHLAAVTGVELATDATVDVADVASAPVVDPEVSLGATIAQLDALEASVAAAYAAVKSVNPNPYGDGTTDATAHIQGVIDAANAAGEGVYVPAGTYAISAALENVQRLTLAPGATIKATAAMGAVVRTSLTANLYDGFVTGKGVIDANDQADYCIHPRYFVRFEVNGLNLRNGKVGGIKLGNTGTAGRSAEANLQNLHIERKSPLTVPVGSRGIVVENSGDHTMSSIIVNGFETGVYLPASGNTMLRDVHVWTAASQGATKTGFEDHSNNSHYLQCHADTPTEYGWRLYGYQTTLVQCGTYLNPNDPNATDNTVVGVKFEGANPIATIVGHFFLGGSASKRLKADIEAADANYGLVVVVPVIGQHVVTVRAFRTRVVGLDSRDPIESTQGMRVNAPTPSNGAGFSVRTNGLDRWKLVTDGAAESGGNAGSGLRLTRHADDGTQLAEVFWVARTGTWVQYSNVLYGPSASIIPDGTNGLKIATNSAQKLGFFGNTPVVKPAALPAIDSTATGTTWGAEEKAVLDNTRQRLQNLEWRLQALGLLS